MSIRVPYKNLRNDADAEVEIMKFEEEANRRMESDTSNVFPHGIASNSSSPSQGPPTNNCSLITLILSCTVAAGVQFGWALQLSLLTPYIQVFLIFYFCNSNISRRECWYVVCRCIYLSSQSSHVVEQV